MRPPLLLLGLSAAIVLVAPAHADPGGTDPPAPDNPAFLSSLERAGISYTDANQVITAAQAVCGLAGTGKSGLDVLKALTTANPGFTTDGAAQFAAIAANTYCPQQLAASDTTK